MINRSAVFTFFLALSFFSRSAMAADAKLLERLDLSATAFHELMQSGDSSIPEDMLRKSEGVVIFPRTLNLAWGLGGEYGRGVALHHDKKTGRWSSPAFYTLGGLTLGPQIGGQAIDIVLVVMNEKGLTSLLESKCTLGGDAGIAVGPAGRNATASTDLGLKAEIYSYSRAKGLYIGLSLKGAVVTPDNAANEDYYGRRISARDILLQDQASHQSSDHALMKEFERFSKPGFDWKQVLFLSLAVVGAIFLLNFLIQKLR